MTAFLAPALQHVIAASVIARMQRIFVAVGWSQAYSVQLIDEFRGVKPAEHAGMRRRGSSSGDALA